MAEVFLSGRVIRIRFYALCDVTFVQSACRLGWAGWMWSDRSNRSGPFGKEPDSVFQSVVDGQLAAIQPLISSDLINRQLGRGFDVSL